MPLGAVHFNDLLARGNVLQSQAVMSCGPVLQFPLTLELMKFKVH